MSAISRWIDERVDLASIRRTLLDRKMPSGLTWWHTLGSATLAVFIVQVATGIVLAMLLGGQVQIETDRDGIVTTGPEDPRGR